jgi:hypothetical protein
MNADTVERARSIPIESEIMRRGIKLRRQGQELVGPCPRCGGDDRFAVHVKKQFWNCRICKKKEDDAGVIGLVRWLDGCGVSRRR